MAGNIWLQLLLLLSKAMLEITLEIFLRILGCRRARRASPEEKVEEEGGAGGRGEGRDNRIGW